MSVSLVCDSTAYLPGEAVESHDITVVPVQVAIAGQPFDDVGADAAARVEAALQAWQPVTTSRPSPSAFAAAYAAAADRGATGVVCATLSAAMSATYESAVLAARDAPVPVEVVDSHSIVMGLGFGVLAGAATAASGAPVGEVAAVVAKRCEAATVLFYVDTLEYLRRGGRISATRAAVGQALQVKPILRVVDGRIVPLERVRTAGKALSRMEELAVEAAAGGDVDVAVHHLGSPDRAAALAARLRDRLPDATVLETPVGAVVGAHVGPGAVAVVVSPR